MPNEEIENQVKENELNDVEIAELAKAELNKRDREIRNLEKELAKAKLYSKETEQEIQPRTKEDCIATIFNPNVCNYDYAIAVLDLVDIETKAGRKNPLGKNGQAVYDFLDECVAACDGDKSKFPIVYQAKIGKDDLPIRKNRR